MQLSVKNSRIGEEYENTKENNNNTFTNTIGSNPNTLLHHLPKLQQHTTYP